jgi:hypothetical protein
MAKKRAARKKRDRDIPLSMHGLTFEEALAATMQVKPPPKAAQKRQKRRSR